MTPPNSWPPSDLSTLCRSLPDTRQRNDRRLQTTPPRLGPQSLSNRWIFQLTCQPHLQIRHVSAPLNKEIKQRVFVADFELVSWEDDVEFAEGNLLKGLFGKFWEMLWNERNKAFILWSAWSINSPPFWMICWISIRRGMALSVVTGDENVGESLM